MRISELVKHLDKNLTSKLEIINEKEFDFFSLPTNDLNQKNIIFIEDLYYFNDYPINTTMIITTTEIYSKLPKHKEIGFLTCNNPRLTFFLLHNIASDHNFYKIHYIPNSISKSAVVSSFAILSNTNIIVEDNVVIEDRVIINSNVTIKKNSIIRSGSIIGGTGFEFKKQNNDYFLVKHLGSVIIDEDVEIQHNCVVDKAIYPYDSTIIGKNTKIDNFVHIAHAVKLGKSVLVAAGVIIAGRTKIGDNCWIGPGAVISNGIIIKQNSRVNLGAVVINNLKENSSVSGNFAINHEQLLKNLIKLKKE
jgi:UDP-3-O-[3-hydroxymyristoyl] glucosamine N-acyltransferase